VTNEAPIDPSTETLLSVDSLRVEIKTKRGMVVPSDDVSYVIGRGEVVGLVGESGCGKTMTALATIGLLPSRAEIASGSITFDGTDLAGASEATLREFRGSRIGYISQDATAALDPVLRVRTQIEETLAAHLELNAKAVRERSIELLRSVGIPEPEARLEAYPHELSGGMRQRVAIAIALSCDPQLVIADEPTTALDVTVQAQVVELIASAARERGTAVLLISHDLGLVSRVTDRTMVMYAGRIVESGPTVRVTERPEHPYTEALLAATPRVRADRLDRFPTIPGRPPDLVAPPSGCRFAPRCPHARDLCAAQEPLLSILPVACWYPRSRRGEQLPLERQHV
jgi:peptide/nickel transport system ATP-binding protein